MGNPNIKDHAHKGGRPKGSRNKTTIQLKEAILEALEGVGGTAYLEQIAKDNPSAFIQLVAKVLPLQTPTPDKDTGQVITIIRATKPDADSTN